MADEKIEPIHKAIGIVAAYVNNKHNLSPWNEIDTDEFSIVWFCYILGGWKALVTTPNIKTGIYYEVTYNKNKQETYLDVYSKVENACYTDEWLDGADA